MAVKELVLHALPCLLCFFVVLDFEVKVTLRGGVMAHDASQNAQLSLRGTGSKKGTDKTGAEGVCVD